MDPKQGSLLLAWLRRQRVAVAGVDRRVAAAAAAAAVDYHSSHEAVAVVVVVVVVVDSFVAHTVVVDFRNNLWVAHRLAVAAAAAAGVDFDRQEEEGHNAIQHRQEGLQVVEGEDLAEEVEVGLQNHRVGEEAILLAEVVAELSWSKHPVSGAHCWLPEVRLQLSFRPTQP